MFKIGIVGGRGLSGLSGISAMEDVCVSCVCDLDESVLTRAKERIPDVKTFRLYEDMLLEDIDAEIGRASCRERV